MKTHETTGAYLPDHYPPANFQWRQGDRRGPVIHDCEAAIGATDTAYLVRSSDDGALNCAYLLYAWQNDPCPRPSFTMIERPSSDDAARPTDPAPAKTGEAATA